MADKTEAPVSNDSGWVPCCQGEISGLVNRLQRQRRLATTAKASSIVGVLLLGFGLWMFAGAGSRSHQASAPKDEYNFSSICCSEVTQYAAAFQKGELDEELTAQVREHVEQCPHCGPKFDKMARKPQASAVRPGDRFRVAALPAGSHLALLTPGN